MADLRALLQRFRPAGVPGAATRASVPVDRAAEQAAELAPLFERLGPVERECGRIEWRAEQRAQAVRAVAALQAQYVIAGARRRELADRASEASAWLEALRAASPDRRAAARQEADAVGRTGAGRIPGMAARILADADRLTGGGPGTGPA